MQNITQKRRKQFSKRRKKIKRATNITEGSNGQSKEKTWKGRDVKIEERLDKGRKDIKDIFYYLHFLHIENKNINLIEQ